MTYTELAQKIAEMTPEQANSDVILYDEENDTWPVVVDLKIGTEDEPLTFPYLSLCDVIFEFDEE